jgi:Arc/MetJ-type ribon-helix-helix transcriptional regulator
MTYTDGQIKTYIRDVVREARATANVDTGYLKRSIKGDLIGRNKSVEFRQIFYGAYNNNSELVRIAERIMPKNIQWKVVFLDEEGNEQEVKGKSRTGRTMVRKEITSDSASTSKIKAFIKTLSSGKAKDDRTESDRESDNE